MVDERIDLDFLVPVAVAPAARVVDGDLRDPIDGRETRAGICRRDRVEHHAVTVRAEPDERGPRADRHPGRHAAPHDGAAPSDRRLVRVHLSANRRMQPVGADQQLSRDLHSMAVAALYERRDALGVLAEASDS